MKGLSPEEVTAKFHQMGVLLLLDAPAQLEFGIDNISWQVGSKFKGIKLIPLGTHIITYSLKNQNYMFPIKKFIYFGPSHRQVKDDERIRVFRWSTKEERFVSLKGEEAEGYREGVKKYHFDCYLGPYPESNVDFWATNAKHITKAVLDKLDPIEYFEDYKQEYEGNKHKEGKEEEADIDSASEEEIQQRDEPLEKEMEDLEIEEEIVEKDNQKKNKEEEDVNEIKKNKDFGGNIYYSQIPRRLTEFLEQTTKINMDKTQILNAILKSSWPGNELGILGQLQYSFIAFLIGQCLDSYNQWKQLMIVLCSSETAFATHKDLMLEFIAVFYEQVKQFPEDFFIDELAKGNFLTSCFKNLNQYWIEKTVNKKALSRIEKLLALVSEKFSYEPCEEEDQSPIVVAQGQTYF